MNQASEPGGYLANLTSRLRGLVARSPEGFRTRHHTFLRAAQNPDGGVSGREGGSDLYYTAFGLRALAALGALDEPTVQRAAAFLRRSLLEPASVVDFMSLLFAARLVEAGGGPDVLSEQTREWPVRVAAALEGFRRPDGGYGKTVADVSGSTYHTFLVALCYDLIGLALPQPTRVIAFLAARRREDGGYVEVPAARRGGTNPTVAAVTLLGLLGALDPATAAAAVAFLAPMQADDGGLRANARAPLSDLLSSFTGFLTLDALGAADRVDADALRRFAHATEMPSGGFRAGLWDDRADVEYTFYGLGTVALLVSS